MNEETEEYGGHAFILTADLAYLPGEDKFYENQTLLESAQ